MILKEEIDTLFFVRLGKEASETRRKISESMRDSLLVKILGDMYPEGLTAKEIDHLLHKESARFFKLVGLDENGNPPEYEIRLDLHTYEFSKKLCEDYERLKN